MSAVVVLLKLAWTAARATQTQHRFTSCTQRSAVRSRPSEIWIAGDLLGGLADDFFQVEALLDLELFR